MPAILGITPRTVKSLALAHPVRVTHVTSTMENVRDVLTIRSTMLGQKSVKMRALVPVWIKSALNRVKEYVIWAAHPTKEEMIVLWIAALTVIQKAATLMAV